jgi:cyanophycinase
MQVPKGYLIAVGGAEDKGIEEQRNIRNNIDFFKEGILKQITEFAGKRADPHIEIISTASSYPDEVSQLYKKAFRHFGIDAAHLRISTRDEADSPKVIERLEKCNCLLFTGGDQLKLCSILGGTDFIDVVRERYMDDHFIIAGTSAGAAAMSNTMISGGEENKAYMKGKVELSIGFGFLQEVIIDTHFDARGRFGRLVQAIARQPGAVGIGLDEDTGVIVEKGSRLKAIGSSSVVIVDGSGITHNNIADIKDGSPISIANLQVNILTKSDIYDITSRKFMPVKKHLNEK